MRSRSQLKHHIQKTCTCGNNFIFTTREIKSDLFGNEKFNQYIPLAIKCKSYFCPQCAKAKKVKFIKRIEKTIEKETWRFLTLTTVNTGNNTIDVLKEINNSWNKFATLLRRKFVNLKYIKVLEVGKNGMVHYHILINCYIPHQLIQKFWYKYTGAFKVQIEKPSNHNKIIGYLAKYFAKQTDDSTQNELFYLTNKRRFSFSKNCDSKIIPDIKFKMVFEKDYTLDNLISTIYELMKDGYNMKTDFCYDYLPPPIRNYVLNALANVSKPYVRRSVRYSIKLKDCNKNTDCPF